ncbi:MAG: N-6 DNA methylase [Akkermansiaceae bacterium]
MSACCLAMQTREEEYLEVAGKYDREELEMIANALGSLVSEMEQFPFTDLLGPYYCEINAKSGRDQRGEFYTPTEINTLMVKMIVDVDEVIERGVPISVSEPACGSGGIVLALAEEFAKAKAVDLIRATAQDISRVACDMAYVNLTLWGIPSHIIWGDTLRNTTKASWKNIHWARVGEDNRLAMKKVFRLLSENAKKPDLSEEDVVMRPIEDPTQQWLFGGPDGP